MNNVMKVAGIVLVVLGALGLILESVSWNEEETLIDVAGIEASATTQETQTIPPEYATGALVLGLVLAATGMARET